MILQRVYGTLQHNMRTAVQDVGVWITWLKVASCAVSTLVSSLTAASCTLLRTARYTCQTRRAAISTLTDEHCLAGHQVPVGTIGLCLHDNDNSYIHLCVTRDSKVLSGQMRVSCFL